MSIKNIKQFHPRSLHNGRYDFSALIASEPALKPFVQENSYGDLSIIFSDSDAVLMLNKALLKHFYALKSWQIPKGYLCPPIPGRADYIHYIADLLAESNGGAIPRGDKVRVLDVGVGANGIYPIVGSSVYGWHFVGSDVDKGAIASVKAIVSSNEGLKDRVDIREQADLEQIFNGVIGKKDRFDFTLCNPPFHCSAEEALKGTARKNRNLHQGKSKKGALNFGGQANELWCPGGEVAFIKTMIRESKIHAKKVLWFSTLVSKKESLSAIYKALKLVDPSRVETIEMQQGQKVTRIVVWTFLSSKQQDEWREKRWS